MKLNVRKKYTLGNYNWAMPAACCLLWLLPVAPTARVGVAGREAVGAGRCLPDAGCGAAPSGRGQVAPARGDGRRREPTLSRPAPRKGPSDRQAGDDAAWGGAAGRRRRERPVAAQPHAEAQSRRG